MSSRIIDIQATMSERAIELLMLPDEPCLLLDLGCGSGLSGEVLSDQGHTWIGLDISPSMLQVALEREVDGDVVLSDIGQGVPFRPGAFDGAISISALQWLCNADKASHNPRKRLAVLFQTLYSSLRRGARAVFQFYPENAAQMEMITAAAMRSGFTGGIVVDFPNSTKAKKYFLCLIAGPSASQQLPKGLGTEESEERGTVSVSGRERPKHLSKKKKKKDSVKSKEWVLRKKDRQRSQGKEVRRDSKYTARKRPSAF
eukprot:TRINITY_DN16849_c0_g1_i1.p1 TRINITY_DN16849_c0_g1~~TRINITY_DN16849_c0_g1_i1.p1  ORF type:complete len:294 (+),score=92.02 TRINITY_DN16849_c0_g1_i1:111-884(+)